jgi:hypothetical protein
MNLKTGEKSQYLTYTLVKILSHIFPSSKNSSGGEVLSRASPEGRSVPVQISSQASGHQWGLGTHSSRHATRCRLRSGLCPAARKLLSRSGHEPQPHHNMGSPGRIRPSLRGNLAEGKLRTSVTMTIISQSCTANTQLPAALRVKPRAHPVCWRPVTTAFVSLSKGARQSWFPIKNPVDSHFFSRAAHPPASTCRCAPSSGVG